jgi:hypothetical protein
MIAWLVILSIVIYLLFYFWDGRQVKDEREKWIDLKTSEFQSKMTLYVLILLAVFYWWHPEMPAWICLLAINGANLYSEIAGKIYWRWKM